MTPLKIAAPLAGNTLGSIDSSFVVAEWRDAGGGSESPRLIAPWHVHHKDDEAWYVLEGELRVRVGAEEVAGEGGACDFGAEGEGHTLSWSDRLPGHDVRRRLPDMSLL